MGAAMSALMLPSLAACGASAPSSTAPSPGAGVGGNVEYQLDGAPATTDVALAADGTGVSGTAVTTFGGGTHTVRLECVARDGDTWAVGGTTDQTTIPGETAGGWSAVIVRDGSPQQIGIWLSDEKVDGVDCDGWLAGIGLSTIDVGNFSAVESGVLTAPATP